jgi:hypothetical protein
MIKKLIEIIKILLENENCPNCGHYCLNNSIYCCPLIRRNKKCNLILN